MKIFLLAFLLFLGTNTLLAQNNNISVDILTELTNDTEGSVARKLDSRDKKCALIKVRTPNLNADERSKFSFQGDAGTEVFLEKGTGELKLFLTEGARKLRIMHDDYGVVEYNIPIQIVGFKTYKMEILVDKEAVNNTPKASLSANYVEVNVEPSDATIIIDDIPVTDGTAYLEIDVDHTLTVSKSMYHPHTQIIRASKSKKMVYNVKLIPAFGWLRIESQPEDGAVVFIDGIQKGKTPLTSAKLESGEHTVKLIKEMFEPLEKTVNVRDNDTALVTLKMRGNFAEVTLNITDDQAEIYVDGKKKSTGSWKGRLAVGTHLIEAKRAYHTSTMKEITCSLGVPQTLTLDSPHPIIGSLNIKSNPSKARIYLDDKDLNRTTPDIIQDVYAGEHRLKIEKEGYSTYDETIIVKENEITNLEVELASTKEVTITTDKYGDKIYVNDKYVGTSPVTTIVKFGENKIRAERGNMKETNTVLVSNSTPNTIKIHVGKEVEIVSRVGPYMTTNVNNNHDEVYIDGKYIGNTKYKGMGPGRLKTTVSKGEHIVELKGRKYGKKRVVIGDNDDQINVFKNSVYLTLAIPSLTYCNGNTPGYLNFGTDLDVKLFSSFVSVVASVGWHHVSLCYTADDSNKYKSGMSEIPLQLKLQLGIHEALNVYFALGYSFYSYTSVKVKIENDPKYTYDDKWEKIDISANKKDKGVIWGAGVTLGVFSLDVYHRNNHLPVLNNNVNELENWEFRMTWRIRLH